MDLQPRLEVIVGTMFSGKSSELINRMDHYEIADYEVLLVKPKIDDRYSETHVTSHDQRKKEGLAIACADDLAQFIKPSVRVIGIDEVQFLDSAIIAACNHYASAGKIVIAAGLLKDFRDEYFPFSDGEKTMADLLQAADHITSLTALCTYKSGKQQRKCGRLATRVQRFVDGEIAPVDSPVVLVGGKEAYAPRCRKHYVAYH